MTGAAFRVGDVLNNTYRIEAVLGRGGTSEVYQARSEISGNRVALKVLRAEFSSNEDFLSLMTREEDIREIRHDAIVRYYHNQRTEHNQVFLVMDFVDGPGLDKKLKQGGMSAADLMVVAERVAEGLRAAHAKLIVHRDLSPDNVILRNGNPADAVIIDFGIAKDSNPGAETIVGNEFAGKYAYAAHEQLSGKADARSDIYALGALLLATFRGKAPDIGNNPLEVIERKGKPLDTAGLPDRFKALIDKMTVPDPEARLQDVDAVLAMIRGEGAADDGDALTDATVIAPRPASTAASAAARPGAQPKAAPVARDTAKAGKGGRFAILGAGLVACAAAGVYFSGLLVPGLPRVDPFTLTLEQPSNGAVMASGHVPTQDMATALSQRLDMGPGDVTLATGNIVETWPQGVLSLVDGVRALPEWRIDVTGNTATVSGLTEDRTVFDSLGPALATAASDAGLNFEDAIELGPRLLDAARLAPILGAYSYCGDLRLLGAPATGYTNGDTVVVTGRVSDEAGKAALDDALRRVVGQRQVDVIADVLNPTLCLFDSVLPQVGSGGFDITFAQGATGEDRATGRFTVGENPVIELVIPASVTGGFVFVSALDVSGNVFHLLPNMNRPENSVAALRGGQGGPVTVRLAHTLAEAAATDGRKLAFVVDDTTLGKTQIVVIHSDAPLLDGMRPTTESAMGYAEALGARGSRIDAIDTRILTTALP